MSVYQCNHQSTTNLATSSSPGHHYLPQRAPSRARSEHGGSSSGGHHHHHQVNHHRPALRTGSRLDLQLYALRKESSSSSLGGGPPPRANSVCRLPPVNTNNVDSGLGESTTQDFSSCCSSSADSTHQAKHTRVVRHVFL